MEIVHICSVKSSYGACDSPSNNGISFVEVLLDPHQGVVGKRLYGFFSLGPVQINGRFGIGSKRINNAYG